MLYTGDHSIPQCVRILAPIPIFKFIFTCKLASLYVKKIIKISRRWWPGCELFLLKLEI